MNISSFEYAVIEIVCEIPFGEVSTYGEIAEEAGFPGAARAVGNVVRTVPDLPWWRVITVNGRLAPGLEEEQTERLRAEGVTVRSGRVLMRGER